MRKKIFFGVAMILCLYTTGKSQMDFSRLQTGLPVISATTNVVSIRDGADFHEGIWGVVPEVRLDIYISHKKGEWVTFYTDQDSIAYLIHSDSIYNFVILLNGRDSAFTQIKYAPTHLEVLKGAGAFNYEEQLQVPAFTYQAADAPALVTLRQELKLDSIAGGGNEISKMLNIMRWLHDLVPHDGQRENPIVKNALSMIEECKRDERGLNCRGLATVLNECYLAMGYPSRILTCLPKDSIVQECHVINIVYSRQLGKWIWLDPTHASYVMDENGLLLDPFEVRTRLINDEPLILNPDANWNHQASTEKEFYLLDYMAKNLYRFDTPLHSTYDYETEDANKEVEYLELVPLDAYQQNPKVSTSPFGDTGMTRRTFKTNNPKIFWQRAD